MEIEKLIPYAEWRRIGDYAVSRCGVIVILPYSCANKWGGTSLIAGKVLAQSNDKNGYKLVTMRRLGWTKNGQVRAHRVIAHCWLGPRPDGMEINHKDGDKANNHADNLEYVTSSENKKHAVKLGLMKTGKEHHNCKTIRLEKDGNVLLLNGVKQIQEHGFHCQSVHRAARKERKTIHGWVASYV